MNTITPEPLDRIRAELIRRGLSPDYALRAAAELEDHRRDLVEELRAAGSSESEALAEASERLGDARTLIKKTVREYQCRHWCGRWPLITFLIGPIPVFLALAYLTGFVAIGIGKLLGKGEGITAIEIWPQYIVAYAAKIWLTLGMPLLMVAVFCWLASRAALGRYWPCVASGALAFFVAFVQCKLGPHPTDANASVFWIGYYLWFVPEFRHISLWRFFWNDPWQVAQLVLPLVTTGGLLLYSSRRLKVELQTLAGAR